MIIVSRRSSPAYRQHLSLLLMLLLTVTVAPLVRAEDSSLTALLGGEIPASLTDLRALQERIQLTADQVIPSTVAVKVGAAHGSGVIISGDGYVLTAAHVAGKPAQRATLILHDGRQVFGETLGIYRTLDAGLIKITTSAGVDEDAQWPSASFGDSQQLAPGQWCLATGHPGGYQEGRPPIVRVGRILSVKDDALNTDCTLIGGDSGGPLFDLQGNVIGIHSRIGGPLTVNLHVPVNTYRTSWERLVAAEAWGRLPGSEPFIGVQGEVDSKIARIVRVFTDSPAQEAGLRVGDVVITFAGHKVDSFDTLKELVDEQQPGSTVPLEVMRGDSSVRLEITIGDRRG